MINLKKCLPLRLILNTNCNGKCPYCHKEGADSNKEMSPELLIECANIAKKLLISTISLTGGEPSLRTDLPDLINDIWEIYPEVKINLTSNGYKLINFCNKISKPINRLNLSMTSFNKEIASLYQNVKPEAVLQVFQHFPAEHKNANIVIVQENYLEIESIINKFSPKMISVDLMFELKKYNDSDYKMQQHIFKLIESFGKVKIDLEGTPTAFVVLDSGCKVSIKHPYLSALQSVGLCNECKGVSKCFERICAVRVYPDAMVTPCLKRCKISSKSSLKEQVSDIYGELERDYSVLGFIK